MKNFLVNYRRRFNLDEVLQEWEAEHGMEGGEGEEDKIEVCPAEEEEAVAKETKEVRSFMFTTNPRILFVSICCSGAVKTRKWT